MPHDDPFKLLAAAIEDRMRRHAAGAVLGLPCELGTMTEHGVKLDSFKHEIRDPLLLEPVVDIDVEASWFVPAHEESGSIVLPGIPTTETPVTIAGEYACTYRFHGWTHDAAGQGKIQARQARIKFRPQYKPGDRVLCALVNGGQDVVIVSRVIPYA